MLSVEFGIHRPLSSRRALEQGTGLITQIVLSPLPARMGTLSASSGTQGPTLDVQVTGPALLLSAFQHSRWSSRAINSDTPRHKLPKSTYLDFVIHNYLVACCRCCRALRLTSQQRSSCTRLKQPLLSGLTCQTTNSSLIRPGDPAARSWSCQR